jgi:hypothetical protein
MREITKIGEALFEKIRSRFEDVSLGDETAKATTDPEKARFFNFDYQDSNGHGFGTVTISLIDENSLKIYFSKNISSKMDEDQRQEWYTFLRELRYFAKRNLLTFDTRDISRSNLNIKDIKQVSKTDSTYSADELSVNESRLYGTPRLSFENIGNARLIVRHNESIDPERRGSRSRHIESIYVENAQGERFRMPVNKLSGARAVARHVSEGGNLYDDVGSYIVNVVNEMGELGRFARTMKHRTFEDVETGSMVEAAISRYRDLHEHLSALKGRRGYSRFMETFQHEEEQEEDVDVTELKERFSRKIFDDRLMDSLNYVHKAYKRQQESRQLQLETVKHVITKQMALVMAENDAQDQYMESLRYVDNTALVTRVLEDIAARAVDMPEVRQFAQRWAGQFGSLNENQPEAVQEERALAVQLATTYLRDLRGIRENANLKSSLRDPIEQNDYEITLEDIDMLSEGTWALPDTPEKLQQLKDLLAQPLKVGVDATNATNALYDLIGDDTLFDNLHELAEISGPETDANEAVKQFIKDKMPGLYDKVVGAEDTTSAPDAAPEAPVEPAPNPADTQPPPATPPMAESEELTRMLRIAGLR